MRPAPDADACERRPGQPGRAPGDWAPSFVMVGGSLPVSRQERRQRRQSFGISVAVQTLLMGGMMAAVVVGPPAPRLRASAPALRLLTYFEMPAPPRRAHRVVPPPRRALKPPPALLVPPKAARAADPPAPVRPPVLLVERPSLAPPAPRPPRPAAAAPPSRPLAPSIALGKFGAPHGLDPLPGRVVPAPEIGSFGAAVIGDPQPSAAPGRVAAAGFDPTGAADPPAAAPSVRSGGFGSLAAAGTPAPDAAGVAASVALNRFSAPRPAAIPDQPSVPSATPEFTPPQVLSWPQPAYTPEAAQHRIEGEVVLRVRLDADGRAEVVGVLRGLGYGLNDAAAAAARQLRFRPAQRRGQPVDWTVEVHMVFKLAY